MKNSSGSTPVRRATNRRQFIRTAAGATAAATALTTAAKGAGVDPAQKLKVGFIGTGGRGTGAAAQALDADD
ncbi:MAG: gfo/Idh/MocA family oxidoreductase, partial [Verrucomicrobiota bacterium]